MIKNVRTWDDFKSIIKEFENEEREKAIPFNILPSEHKALFIDEYDDLIKYAERTGKELLCIDGGSLLH